MRTFRSFRLTAPLFLILSFAWMTLGQTAAPQKIGWIEPVQKNIEGWTVHVDPALLKGGKHEEEGKQALKMLANHLQRIAILLPEEPLKKMKRMEIWLERKHPELSAMQYHPGAKWLIDHGYDPRLNKKVHVTRAAALFSRDQLLKHPAVILHELAHAYHDQVLGFNDPDILAAYNGAMKKGILEKVQLFTEAPCVITRLRIIRSISRKPPKPIFIEMISIPSWLPNSATTTPRDLSSCRRFGVRRR